MSQRPVQRKIPRWLRPMVDTAMTLLFLLQMVPGKMGNALHELTGIAFVVLFVMHHVLNRGWLRRLGRQHTARARVVLVGDVVLTVCVAGVALTGVLMSRSALPVLTVPSVSHVVRPLHGVFAYAGWMACAFHVGLHVRIMCGYARLSIAARDGFAWRRLALLIASIVAGAWSCMRLGVIAKLAGQPSFPDAMTPLPVQLVLHLLLALPFVVVGAMVDAGSTNRQGNRG